MKTSNKILLCLLIVVFTVPLLLAFNIKDKMKKGIYTIEKFDNYRNGKVTVGTFAAFKVVKIVSPNPEYLTCVLRQSSEMKFNYYKDFGNDSVVVSNNNDTLVIQYIALDKTPARDDERNWNAIHVSVAIPAFNSLVVDGAVVVIDSFPVAGNMSVVLKNRGELKEGSKNGQQEERETSRIDKQKTDADATTELSNKVASIGKVENANNSKRINLLNVKALNFDVKELLLFQIISRI